MLNGERLSLHESTKERFQGISCAYLNSSDKIITVCEGFADKESSIPVDENTIFPACSISKFITALCVMKANEKEIIDIDAPVNNYLSHWKLCTVNGDESAASMGSLCLILLSRRYWNRLTMCRLMLLFLQSGYTS